MSWDNCDHGQGKLGNVMREIECKPYINTVPTELETLGKARN